MPQPKSIARALEELRAFGLRYPGTALKSPWPGHLDLAVNDKTFAYLSAPGEPFAITCKLPHSNALALALPFTEPAPYGLGKSGWVSARVPAGEPLPLAMFKAWIDESYRAQAPQKLVAALAPESTLVAPRAPKRAARSPKAAPAPERPSAARPARPAKKTKTRQGASRS
jgi:predicted DNA-binding protein (MmcQ/YjbR family)